MAALVCSIYCIYKLWEKYSTVREGELEVTMESTMLKSVHIFFVYVLIACFQVQSEETTS